MLSYQRHNSLVADATSTKSVNRDRCRLGNPNGIGHLDLTAFCQPCSDNVLGDIATRIGGRAVYFGRIFAREGPTTVARHAAVGINNDLATGQSGVAHWPTDDELACWVDVIQRVFVKPCSGKHGLNNQFHDRFSDSGLTDTRVMLCRQHHRVDGAGFTIGAILQRHLAFRIGPQPGQFAGFAQLRLALYQPVGVINRCRHEYVSFVTRITKHQALIAGSLLFILALVDTHGYIVGLLTDGIEYRTRSTVEAYLGTVVANVSHHFTHDIFKIHIGTGGHLTGYDDHAGLHQCLYRNPRVAVIGQDAI